MPTAQNTRNVYRHTVQKAAVIEDLATTRLPIFCFLFSFLFLSLRSCCKSSGTERAENADDLNKTKKWRDV